MRGKAGPSSIDKSRGGTKQPRVAPRCLVERAMPRQPMSVRNAASGQLRRRVSTARAPRRISGQAT
eukprot:9701185-Alexandrium_andersonii.AAC.1